MIVSVLVIRNGVIPPTLNLENPDDECDLDFCALQPRETTVNTVMSNSFGFGGHNACLMIRKFEG